MAWTADMAAAHLVVPDGPGRRRARPQDAGGSEVQPSATATAEHVRHRVTFRQGRQSRTPSVYDGVPHAEPLCFARAPSGDVYFANGLIPVQKWDGVRYSALPVGVPAPTTAPTLAQAPPAPAAAPTAATAFSQGASITLTLAGDIITGTFGAGPFVSAGLTGAITEDVPGAQAWGAVATVSGGIRGQLRGLVTAAAGAGQLTGTLAGTVSGGVSVTGAVKGVFYGYAPFRVVGVFEGEVTYSTDGSVVANANGSLTTTTVTVNGVRVAAGGGVGSYTAYQRWLDADGNPSNLSPVSNAASLVPAAGVLYSGVQAPTDPRVVRRQLLRNTAGQAVTYYVDVDTTDLAATTFTSTHDDTTLSGNEAVPLFDGDGNSLADRYTPPPADKPVLASYQDRMFAAGDVTYSEGQAGLTNGSATVSGVGTDWTAVLAGRFFYVVGVGRSYQIDAVNVAAQTLTLTETYQGATDPFGSYAIRPPPAQRRLVAFSEAGLYEAWPATNGLSVEENGDDTTGLMVAESFLYVLQRRHVYRLTYHLGPLQDGGLFLAARRGCVNDRCWVYFDGFAYLLDEQGAYRFGGGGDTESLSAAVQDLFWLDHSDGGRHVNWSASKWFHALHNKDERTVRWFVALSGDRLPRHALCYNYDSKAWWLEEYLFPVGASGETQGALLRPLLAGPARRVFAQGIGTLDGPDPKSGQTRLAAAAGGVENVSGPATAAYPALGLAGSPVAVHDGRGKGQVNVVASASGAQVRCVRPWLVRPDATSSFQLGGFPWLWDSGDFRWLNEEGDEARRVEVVFPPCLTPAQCDLRFFNDFAVTPERQGYAWPSSAAGTDSVRASDGSGDVTIDLSWPRGFAQVRRNARREPYVWKADVFSLELAGVAAESPVSIFEVNVEGAI